MHWEVRYIGGKMGRGVFALRTLPKGFRIMVGSPPPQPPTGSIEAGARILSLRTFSDVSHLQVERGLEGVHEHPRVEDLEPDGGTLEEKWRLNEFGVGAGRSKLFLRTAMINHACEPNAGHHVFEGFKVPHPRPGGNLARGKWMVCLFNSHTNATSKRWHL